MLSLHSEALVYFSLLINQIYRTSYSPCQFLVSIKYDEDTLFLGFVVMSVIISVYGYDIY